MQLGSPKSVWSILEFVADGVVARVLSGTVATWELKPGSGAPSLRQLIGLSKEKVGKRFIWRLLVTGLVSACPALGPCVVDNKLTRLSIFASNPAVTLSQKQFKLVTIKSFGQVDMGRGWIAIRCIWSSLLPLSPWLNNTILLETETSIGITS